jgi:hypothetical protein
MPEPMTDADALGVARIHREAGIAQRLDTGGDAIVDEGIEMPSFLGRKVLVDIEPANLASDLGGEGRGIESGDPTDTRTTRDQIRPG